MNAADNGRDERTLEKGARSQDRQDSSLLLSGALFKGFCISGGRLDGWACALPRRSLQTGLGMGMSRSTRRSRRVLDRAYPSNRLSGGVRKARAAKRDRGHNPAPCAMSGTARDKQPYSQPG